MIGAPKAAAIAPAAPAPTMTLQIGAPQLQDLADAGWRGLRRSECSRPPAPPRRRSRSRSESGPRRGTESRKAHASRPAGRWPPRGPPRRGRRVFTRHSSVRPMDEAAERRADEGPKRARYDPPPTAARRSGCRTASHGKAGRRGSSPSPDSSGQRPPPSPPLTVRKISEDRTRARICAKRPRAASGRRSGSGTPSGRVWRRGGAGLVGGVCRAHAARTAGSGSAILLEPVAGRAGQYRRDRGGPCGSPSSKKPDRRPAAPVDRAGPEPQQRLHVFGGVVALVAGEAVARMFQVHGSSISRSRAVLGQDRGGGDGKAQRVALHHGLHVAGQREAGSCRRRAQCPA